MLELLILLPLLMVGLLNMTFQVSIDEVTDVRRDVYFNYRKYEDDQYLKVQDKVHEFYSRMLDESENEIMDDKYGNSSVRRVSPSKSSTDVFQGAQCKMREIQVMHKRCSCRRPRKRCVKIESTRSSVVSVMPECVILERCEGVCPQLMACNPKSTEKVHVPVIYLNLVLTDKGPDVVPECSTAEVEKHLKCGCACAIKEEDCNEKQVYNPAKCRCECKNTDEIEKCYHLRNHWDPANCQCVCPPDISQICSTGYYFHKELCRCVPKNGSYPESGMRRRRPPV
ncbi:balbiani ring protein 3-like [Argiope bruennichi]|uniref:balbiani ring protein 3-like n=1 Tax=Argiope bruennichi TaxID=94029 RepID=UPI002494738F|nr:balbiani ring protein 3-like [Argiope bruennichi]